MIPGKSGMHKFGDWAMVPKLATKMPGAIQMAMDQTLAQISLKAEAKAVKFIQSQELKWKPLSKKYVALKARKGLSTKILIATSQYFQSITSMVRGNVGFAGVSRKSRNDDGQVLADIAAVHEYGSIKRNIPPRRLWSVVFKEMFIFLRDEKLLEKNVILEIQKQIGKS